MSASGLSDIVAQLATLARDCRDAGLAFEAVRLERVARRIGLLAAQEVYAHDFDPKWTFPETVLIVEN